MTDFLKKHEDELLVVHKPRPPADRMGRAPIAPPEMLVADVDGLAARLRATADADERARLLTAIQGRFGNAFAAQVMEAFRRRAPGPPPDEPTSGGHR